ncbi:MAG: UDP-3-O-acyl-N-acetylglucosamine deacetylase [Rickettsiales bacterium]
MKDLLVQQTVSKIVSIKGVGVHTGEDVNLTIKPAAANTGIEFIRIDLKDNNHIKATYTNVIETNLCTVIANEAGAKVSTIEHLMSALWGCGVDNAIVELDGEEVPIMDGSSAPFVEMLKKAGLKLLNAPRKVLEILKAVRLEVDGKTIEILPGKEFEVSFDLDYDHKSIGKQFYTFKECMLGYIATISKARTFGFAKDVECLKKIGLARGASLENAVGIDDDGVMNKEGLRYQDEFVRHKVLDCIGDLYLSCMRIKGKVHAAKAGHSLNNLILRKLFAQPDAFRILEEKVLVTHAA